MTTSWRELFGVGNEVFSRLVHETATKHGLATDQLSVHVEEDVFQRVLIVYLVEKRLNIESRFELELEGWRDQEYGAGIARMRHAATTLCEMMVKFIREEYGLNVQLREATDEFYDGPRNDRVQMLAGSERIRLMRKEPPAPPPPKPDVRLIRIGKWKRKSE